MSNDKKIQKWKNQLQVIREEVSNLVWSVDIYSETRQIVTDNPKISTGNRFYEWIMRNYVHATLMGIRRQVDTDRETICLESLLYDMKKYCHLLNRERHIALYDPEMRSLGDRTFDNLAGKTKDIFPVEMLEQDLRKLEQIRSLHKKYIDKRICHHDKVKEIEEIGTFQDLDDAVLILEKIVRSYYLLILAQDLNMRTNPDCDWKMIFKQTWISDANAVSGNK